MTSAVFGTTSLGLPIPAYRFGFNGPEVLIVGGVHGDEPEGVVAAYGLLKYFSESFPFQLQVTLVPALNLDGVIASTRTNAHGVDLNRNMPTNDWTAEILNPRYPPGPSAGSEPETQALLKHLAARKPKFFLSLHSWKPVLNINGRCRPQAEMIRSHTGYEIVEDIGYPTPGSHGTYCGLERDFPTLTYEIERGLAPQEILRLHVPAMLEALKVTERLASR